MTSSERLPIVSFFSGAGGLDLGFRQAGFETIFAADNDLAAVNTFNANTGYRDIASRQDLSSVPVQRIIHMIEDIGTKPVGIIGGPPCQGFSRGNCKSYAEDPRNKLPLAYAELVSALRKKFNIDFFVFENVPGIRNARHIDTYNCLKNTLAGAGFILFEGEIESSRFGVPQIRNRLLLVGINRFKYPTSLFRKVAIILSRYGISLEIYQIQFFSQES
jgi:DNA (cytosine-5)-methyltransferase 1